MKMTQGTTQQFMSALQPLQRDDYQVMFGHAGGTYPHPPEHLSTFWPMQAKLLLLLRHPVSHRSSWFQVGRSKHQKQLSANSMKLNFSGWIRSKSYREWELGLQLAAYTPLMGTAGSGADLALRLISNPRVAWVGVLEWWLQSLSRLEQVLGINTLMPLAERRERTEVIDGQSSIVQRMSFLSAADFAFLVDLEAKEAHFVLTAARMLVV